MITKIKKNSVTNNSIMSKEQNFIRKKVTDAFTTLAAVCKLSGAKLICTKFEDVSTGKRYSGTFTVEEIPTTDSDEQPETKE